MGCVGCWFRVSVWTCGIDDDDDGGNDSSRSGLVAQVCVEFLCGRLREKKI